LISRCQSGKKEGPAGLGSRLAQRTNKIKMKITELALSSSFDDFFDVISRSQSISRSDAYDKYLLLRRSAAASKSSVAKSSKGQKAKRLNAYQSYLRSPQWNKKRKDALSAAGYRCQICSFAGTLHVHHLTYRRLKNEPLSDLQVLCENCHGNAHENDGKAISKTTADFMHLARKF
jgi:5-methylcytosine-specific restriction endonuclease McrA